MLTITGEIICIHCGLRHDESTCVVRRRIASGTVPVKPSKFRPGDIIGAVLQKMGYEKNGNCGCAAFAEKMNAWGWWGCVRNQREIIDWFAAKAREQGIQIDQPSIWKLIRAGFRDAWTRRASQGKRSQNQLPAARVPHLRPDRASATAV